MVPIPHTPEQNGVAERNWLTLFNDVRTLLADSELGKHWWGMALLHAAETRNHVLSAGRNQSAI